MSSSTSKPKGALIAALIFLLLGIGGCGFAAAKTLPFISDLWDFANDMGQVVDTQPMGTPVTFRSSGSSGVVLLSEQAVCTGEASSGEVRFQGYQSFGTGTDVDINGVQLDGYILFDTTSGADYTIVCGAEGTGSYMATTAPDFLVDGADGLGTGILSGLAGSFCVLLSIILLIVGLVQRSSWKKRNQGTPGGPPGAPMVAPAGAPPAPGQSAWGEPPAPQGAPGLPPQGPAPMPPPQQPPPFPTQPPQAPQPPAPQPPAPQPPGQQPPGQQPPPPPAPPGAPPPPAQ